MFSASFWLRPSNSGSATRVGPSDTVTSRDSPARSLVPAAGSWVSTSPVLVLSRRTSVVFSRQRPSAAWARTSSTVAPTTCGTSAAEDSTKRWTPTRSANTTTNATISPITQLRRTASSSGVNGFDSTPAAGSSGGCSAGGCSAGADERSAAAGCRRGAGGGLGGSIGLAWSAAAARWSSFARLGVVAPAARPTEVPGVAAVCAATVGSRSRSVRRMDSSSSLRAVGSMRGSSTSLRSICAIKAIRPTSSCPAGTRRSGSARPVAPTARPIRPHLPSRVRSVSWRRPSVALTSPASSGISPVRASAMIMPRAYTSVGGPVVPLPASGAR